LERECGVGGLVDVDDLARYSASMTLCGARDLERAVRPGHSAVECVDEQVDLPGPGPETPVMQ